MTLFNYLFPYHAKTTDLREQVRTQRRMHSRSKRRTEQVDKRVEDLEGDVGYLALVLGTLLATLDEKGVVHRTELKDILAELDDVDGVSDGRLDVDVLRSINDD
ncbi:MAG: hypothetical protein ACI8QC_000409 [Planctomycetota bacterium]|jgi:hypothetical protein